jgi:peroxiredoxin
VSDYQSLPADLPRPVDDGAANHLPGLPMPALTLATTDGTSLDLAALGAGRTVMYVYPMTGRPGVDLPAGWDEIAGARGCTPESCGFRDHYAELTAAGAKAVYGLSSQDTDHQREAVERLQLPFAMISDTQLDVAKSLRLPTFDVEGKTLYKRITLIVDDSIIEHVFYPIFPPNEHAEQVLAWLRTTDANTSSIS